MSRYDRGRHDYDAFARGAPMQPYGWYPGAFWGGAPMYGWGAWGGAWGWPPYVPMGYGVPAQEFTPRRRPEESPTYGRGGDRAVREWAERHGYGFDYSIQPREPVRRGRTRRYDRGW